MATRGRSREMTRRRFLQAAATSAASAALLGTASKQAGAAAPAVLRGARIHLLRWASFLKEEDAWFESIKTRWAQPNGVNLIVENVNPNDLLPKTSAAMVAGTGPDLVMLLYNAPHQFEAKLRDVSAIAEKVGKEGGGYYDVGKAYSFTGSGWRAVPWAHSVQAVVYRADWLKEIGETRFPDTFEEANRVSKVIKQKYNAPWGQAWSHSLGDPPNMAYPLMWAYGGAEVDKAGKKVAINSPETIASVEFAIRWFKESMTPDMLGWDDTSNNRSYLAGGCWATNNGPTIYLVAKKDFPDIAKVSEHTLLPAGPKGRYLLGPSMSYGIPSYVKDPKPAEELILWMHENYGSYLDAVSGYVSPYVVKKYKDHPSWDKDPKMTLFKDVSLYRWVGWPGPASPASAEVYSKSIVVDMYAKAMQGMAPKDAVIWAEAELKRIYENA
jgi:multiple sugar transport system substrate-binding protein